MSGFLVLLVRCQSTPVTEELKPTPTQTIAVAMSNRASDVRLVSTVVLTPTPRPSSTPTPLIPSLPIPTPAGPPFTYHTIEEGETLGYIALYYDTTIEQLVEMNDLEWSCMFS